MKLSTLQNTFSALISMTIAIAFLFYGVRASIHVASISFFILMIVAILLYFFVIKDKACSLHGEYNKSIFKDVRLILIAFLAYALVSVLSLIHDAGYLGSWRFQESFLKFGLFGVLIFFFFKLGLKINLNIILGSMVLGGLVNSSVAIFFRLVLSDEGRISLSNGIFQFAYFNAVIAIISLNMYLSAHATKPLKALSLLTFLTCASALVLSVSRGIIAGFLISVILTCLIHYRFQNASSILKKLGVVVALMIVPLLLTPKIYTPLLERLSEGKVQTQDFNANLNKDLKNVNSYGSVGLRYIIWDNAVAMFNMHPILGMNIKMRQERRDEILDHTHFKVPVRLIGESHNEILNAASKGGVLGIAALLFMIFSIFKIFASKLKDEAFLPASCMIGILFIYVTDGIFNTPLDSRVEAILFALCVLISLSIHQKKTSLDSRIFLRG